MATAWIAACLHVDGWSVANISRRLRITDVTARKHLKTYGLKGEYVMTLRSDLDLALAKLAATGALLRSAQAAQTQAIDALEQAAKRAVKDGLNTRSPEAWPITDHRRNHRPGRARSKATRSCKPSSRRASTG